MVKNLVVGAGLSGATVARRIAEDWNEPVTVLEAKDHIGGNLYEQRRDGILVQCHGPHIFHTNNGEVWNFLSRFTRWRPYWHRTLGWVDGQLIPIPFNLNSLRMVFPPTLADRLEDKLLRRFGFGGKVPILALREERDGDLNFLAEYVYQKIFLGYTRKQWGVEPGAVDPRVLSRIPVRIDRDDRYFQDRYQGIPLEGYTAIVQRMLDHGNITVHLSTPFDREMACERLFWTGSADEFFAYEFGALPYRSVTFDSFHLPQDRFQPVAVVNYPDSHDFTRITEHKHFLCDRSDGTIISCEYAADWKAGENDRQYPIENERNAALYARYLGLAQHFPNVHLLGRLGDYRYYNMDEAVARALALVRELAGGRREGK